MKEKSFDQLGLDDAIVNEVVSAEKKHEEVITLKSDYDKSRHSFTVSNDIYHQWDLFVSKYYERGAVLNAALSHFIKSVESGALIVVDRNTSEVVNMSIVDEYLK